MTTDPALVARLAALEAVVDDMLSGFRYVRARQKRGDLDPWYGFGIERLEATGAAALHPPAPPPIDPETVIGDPKEYAICDGCYYIPSGSWAWHSLRGWVADECHSVYCLADALAIRARLVRDRVLPPGSGDAK